MAMSQRMLDVYDKIGEGYVRDEESNLHKILSEIFDAPLTNIDSQIADLEEIQTVNECTYEDWRRTWSPIFGYIDRNTLPEYLHGGTMESIAEACMVCSSKSVSPLEVAYDTQYINQPRIMRDVDLFTSLYGNLIQVEVLDTAYCTVPTYVTGQTEVRFNQPQGGLAGNFMVQAIILMEEGSAYSPSVVQNKWRELLTPIINRYKSAGTVCTLTITIVEM